MSSKLSFDERLPDKGQGDYQYLIPLDDESALLMVRLARRKGRIVEQVKDSDAAHKNPSHLHYKTKDNRGPLQAVDSEYQHSKTWEYPWGPGAMSRVAIKQKKAKGVIPVYDRWGGEHYIHVSVDIPFTHAEARDKKGEVRKIMEEKASDKLRNRIEQAKE